MSTVAPLTHGRPHPGSTWWQQYVGALQGQHGLPVVAKPADITHLSTKCDEIIQNIPSLNNQQAWTNLGTGGVHSSIVAGCIQSGKTRSMIGVTAKALDLGYRLIVVLAGLKNDLREQTAKRLSVQLLQQGHTHPTSGVCSHPNGPGTFGSMVNVISPNCWHDYHESGWNVNNLQQALNNGASIVLVIKKIGPALSPLAQDIGILSQLPFLNAPMLPMLVIDDESDEASVSNDPQAPTPSQIQDLWLRRPGGNHSPVAYVGYTATSQANIFQDINRPFYPMASAVLSYPANVNTSVSYQPHTNHPDYWYTGSDIYYHWLEQVGCQNFLVRPTVTPGEAADDVGFVWNQSELKQAILAYFVSGAIRLLTTNTSLGRAPFDAPAHSMLVHTDGKQGEHRRLARNITEICNGSTMNAAPWNQTAPSQRINAIQMQNWLANYPNDWQYWYDQFLNSFSSLQQVYSNSFRPHQFPLWNDVRNTLNSDVFGNVKLRLVNSSQGGETFDFSDAGKGVPPRQDSDVFSILIGGNILSRGLTIDGLSISYYTRRPNKPVDDTTAQRQRWFGYRGKHIEYCRLFTTAQTHQELRQLGNSDKEELVHLEDLSAKGITDFKRFYIKTYGVSDKSTNKTGTSQHLSISYSGKKIEVKSVSQPNTGLTCPIAQHNEDQAHSTLLHLQNVGTSYRRNNFIQWNVPALDIANYLDNLYYDDHNPGTGTPIAQRFSSLENMYGIPAGSLFRSPHGMCQQVHSARFGTSDPYKIAAYLRAWHHMFIQITTHHQPNWAHVIDANGDVQDWTPVPAPEFNVVFRGGSVSPTDKPFVNCGVSLPMRHILHNKQVNALWGGAKPRNQFPGLLRDESFDYPSLQDPDLPRPQTRNGLLMFYVLDKTATQCNYYIPTVALVVPEGGPSLSATAS